MTRIFISYKSEDRAFALRIADQIIAWGGDVWIDVREMRAGETWPNRINRGLQECGLMLLIVTPESMASQEVEEEWLLYNRNRKPIIPLVYRSLTTPYHYKLEHLQRLDFERQSFDAAMGQLRIELGHKGIALGGIAKRPTLASLMPAPFEMVTIPAGKVTLIDRYNDA